MQRNNKSGYKGVHFAQNKWHVEVRGKHVGYFDDVKDAARAYNEKALELFGEFANLNII